MGSVNPKWINAVQNLPYAERQRVTNSSGSEIAKYALVEIAPSGTDGNYAKIAAAAPTAASGHGKLGICLYKTIDGARTDIAPWAIIRDVNTSGATTVGDPIYLAASGAWSTTKSTRIVGKVLKKDATEGVILLDPSTEQSSLIVSGKATISVSTTVVVALGAAMAGATVITSAGTAGSHATVDGAGEMTITGTNGEVVSYIADGR
jgi:hypothetical protein